MGILLPLLFRITITLQPLQKDLYHNLPWRSTETSLLWQTQQMKVTMRCMLSSSTDSLGYLPENSMLRLNMIKIQNMLSSMFPEHFWICHRHIQMKTRMEKYVVVSWNRGSTTLQKRWTEEACGHTDAQNSHLKWTRLDQKQHWLYFLSLWFVPDNAAYYIIFSVVFPLQLFQLRDLERFFWLI